MSKCDDFFGNVERSPMKKWLDFGGEPANRDLDSEIFTGFLPTIFAHYFSTPGCYIFARNHCASYYQKAEW